MGRQECFAEYGAIDEHYLYPTPDKVSDDDVAACALVGITAHLGLFREARLKSGETLFVNGGSGGVGSMVIQMAKAAGARIAATAGGDEKAAACRKLGADLAINYKTQDVAASIKEFAPNGVNLYWETTRDPDFDRIVPLLAERGRIVLMAGREARPPFPVGPFYVKGCSMHGFVMFKATPDEQRSCADDINQWLAAGKLHAHISHTFPLSQAAEAHRLQEENTLRKAGSLAGKIVLHTYAAYPLHNEAFSRDPLPAMQTAKRIVITGASRGLGRALANEFAEQGHRVCGCARSREAIDSLRRAWPAPNQFDVVDVADAAQVDAWAHKVLAEFGTPDLLLKIGRAHV